MATIRLAPVPFEHVEAELAAFPIASEFSFYAALVELDSAFVGAQQKCLWRAAEREILVSIPSVALDEFVMIRDRVWFGEHPNDENPRSRLPLADYLNKLSTQYLDAHGRPIDSALQSDGHKNPSPRARLRWSWLCRALPPDLLRVARDVKNADDSPFELSPIVERLLQDHGFAETHLHLGAAADFSLLWANLMHALAVEEIKEKSFESPGAYFDDGRKLAKWLMWAATTRLVLAEWLFGSDGIGDRAKLLDFTNARWSGRMDAVMVSDLHRLISELAKGREGINPVRFSRGRTLYRSLIRPLPFLLGRWEERQRLRSRYEPKCRLDVFENDPLAHIVDWRRKSGASPESIFVRESLRYIKKDHKDEDFARLFWQVMRVRCLLYRHLVLRPLTPGLQWFVRFFSRISPIRQSLPDAVSMKAAVHQSGSGKGLRSLEVRLGTEESASECLDKVRQVIGVRTRPVDIEVGGVFHFSRHRGGGWRKGLPNAYGLDHSYPGIPPDNRLRSCQDVGNPSGFRFARYYLEQRRHAQALVSVLRAFPRALRTIRGIDLCADEAGVPIWVMAPLVRWVREAGRSVHMNFQDKRGDGIPQLRATVHAGEDFVNLLTGLRRIDDAIRHLEMEEGDRIGHGVALGLDPEAWIKRTGRVIQTREERLFDLVWEWNCYANQGVGVESGRLAYVQSNIIRLAREMFDVSAPLTPEDLIHFVGELHCEQQLKALGFPDRSRYLAPTVGRSEGDETESRKLMRDYLRNTRVWRNGRVLETIVFDELGHELEALRSLQRSLRQKVGMLGLTVEVNPSSNLLISDLGHLEEHPIWRLSQPLDEVLPLSVCIGSDDPLTFATNLPHEYQLLFDRMVQAGQSHEVALDWLDKAREAGMRGRFTLPRSTTRWPKKLTPSLLEIPPLVPPP